LEAESNKGTRTNVQNWQSSHSVTTLQRQRGTLEYNTRHACRVKCRMALHTDYGIPTEKSVLLQKLQLDPEQRGDSPGRRRCWWVSGSILLFLAPAAAATAFLLRSMSFNVKTALAVAPSGAAGTTAILQAMGYVTAPAGDGFCPNYRSGAGRVHPSAPDWRCPWALRLGGGIGAAIAWMIFDGFTTFTVGDSGQVVFAFNIS
jgi:hypothetical protein